MRELPLCACIGPRTISAGAGLLQRPRREAEYGLTLSSCKRRRLAWQIHHDFERAALKASSLKDDQMPEMEATDFGALEARTQWLFTHADELGVEPSRIAIGGPSGGGGLTAGLALLARDRKEVPVAFQLLIYPMIDDRNVTPARYAITDPRVWNRESNRLGWKAYLGRDGGGADVSPYAAAARATDLTNLPPTYISDGLKQTPVPR